MKKIALIYGFSSGLVMVGLFSLFFALGDNSPENYTFGEIVGYTTMILCLLAVFLGIRTYRDKHRNGIISFWQACKLGLYITFIASFCFGIYSYVLYEYITPDFLHEYYTYYEQQIRESGQPQEVIDEQLAELQAWGDLTYNTFFNGFIMFVTVFLIGTVISLVSAAVLKRR